MHGEFEFPIWTVIPFLGMLLSIAIFPLVKPHFWEKHMLKIALGWALLFLVYYIGADGFENMSHKLLHTIILDYIPFIVLLFGLYMVSGGIVIKGPMAGAPKGNLIMILIGTVLASWIGTTGASVLMIRPVLRANSWREKNAHVVIFFIFLVSNVGGCLTPIGDPPLFLGFLRNVPFFWPTTNLFPVLLLNSVILFVVFYFLDRHYYKQEHVIGNRPVDNSHIKMQIKGFHNFIFIAMIVFAVIISGVVTGFEFFKDQATGELKGLEIMEGLVFPFNSMLQIIIILIAVLLTKLTTKKEIHKENEFEMGPIKEVASLFIGIFITMIPALELLGKHGSELGLSKPWHFFWSSGIFSSFLDNAPTYLVFLTTAGSLGANSGIETTVGTIAPGLLLAISVGAVFMGANTYIGNAPNFMVKSIAESNKVKMPSFFGYMAWSGIILVPLYIIDTFVFFVFGK